VPAELLLARQTPLPLQVSGAVQAFDTELPHADPVTLFVAPVQLASANRHWPSPVQSLPSSQVGPLPTN
jgi:hypothetical protein